MPEKPSVLLIRDIPADVLQKIDQLIEAERAADPLHRPLSRSRFVLKLICDQLR